MSGRLHTYVAGGGAHTLQVTGGKLLAWGENGNGQLGDGTTTDRSSPAKVVFPTGTTAMVQAVAAGSQHSLALTSDGEVWAWGGNAYGQLGDGSITDRGQPVRLTTLGLSGRVIAIAAGGEHSLALTADGMLWSWGRNDSGQLGDGTTVQKNSPVAIGAFLNVKAMSGGGAHSLALLSDGSLYAWGDDTSGQLGNAGVTGQSNTPVPVQFPTTTRVIDLAAGGAHSLALEATGQVWGWGANASGQVGNGSTTDQGTPVQVSTSTGLSRAVKIAAGSAHSLALTSDGDTFAWGDNTNGQIGDGSTTDRTAPAQVSTSTGLTGASMVAAGNEHSLAFKDNGTVWAWGKNLSGQVGNGNTTDQSSPVSVSTLAGTLATAAAWNQSYALKANGTLLAWGENVEGQLGDGSLTQRNSPVPVVGPSGTGKLDRIIAVAAGGFHVLALRSDGTVWAWGHNYYGQIGQPPGSSQMSMVPVQVELGPGMPLIRVKAIAAGTYHSLAITDDGQLWAWGYNASGQLGIGSTGNINPDPLPVSIGMGVISIAGGNGHSLALMADSSVWAWGRDSHNQVGDGHQDSTETTPKRVMDDPNTPVYLDNVIAITSGLYHHSLALDAAGRVWAWGWNNDGQVGDGNSGGSAFAPSANLVRGPGGVGNLADISAIAAGGTHSVALKSNGTVWGWGRNDFGQLGDGSTTSPRLFPVQALCLAGVVGLPAGNCLEHNVIRLDDWSRCAVGANGSGQLGDGGTAGRDLYLCDGASTLSTTVVVHDVACYGGQNGKINLTVSGGQPAYTFAWSNGATTEDIFGLTAGDYSVTIRDSGKSCDYVEATVSELPLLSVSTTATDATCHGSADGTATAIVSGGVPGYTYGWDDPATQSTGTATGLAAGTYTVSITDANQCPAQDVIAVGEPTALLASLSALGVNCHGENEGAIDLTVSGGTPPYSYSWSNGATTEDLVDLPAGGYTVSVQDANACSLNPVPGVFLTEPASVAASRISGTVAAGRVHSVVLESDSSVWAWGDNGFGQIGDGTRTRRLTPVRVKDGAGHLSGVDAVAAGGHFSLALTSGGTVRSWGTNVFGELGNGGSGTLQTLPVTVSSLSGITAIAAGFWHALALDSNGDVWTWGHNNHGQLGDGTTTDRSTPVQILGPNNIVAIAAGIEHSLALDGLGQVWAWGKNDLGQLGDGSAPTDSPVPVLVSGLSSIAAIGSGGNHGLAVDGTASVWGWGWNGDGQLGDGTVINRSTPVAVSGLVNAVAVTGGDAHSVALRASDCLSAWGWNDDGQLGDGTTTTRLTPHKIAGVNRIIDFTAGDLHGVIRRWDENLCTTGLNDGGQLGNGTTASRSAYACSSSAGSGNVGIIGLYISDDPIQNGGFEDGFVPEALTGPHDRSILMPPEDQVPLGWTRSESFGGGESELSQFLVKGSVGEPFGGPTEIGQFAPRWIRQEGQPGPPPDFNGMFTGDGVNLEQQIPPASGDVTGADSLILDVDVRIDFHNLGGSGPEIEEDDYPAVLEVDYIDLADNPATWLFGWYSDAATVNHDPGEDGAPGAMTTADHVPQDDPLPPDFYDYGTHSPWDGVDMLPPSALSEMLTAGEWTSRSFDLLAEIPDVKTIERIRVGGKGWSYQGSVDNISLQHHQSDSDADGSPDWNDACPLDPAKTLPGACGCSNPDTDSDTDGTPDCLDGCSSDPAKTAPGLCGCSVSDTDSDTDGTPDCSDRCPLDPLKISPGACGCGQTDDADGDGLLSCAGDCDDANGNVWSTPGEARSLWLGHDPAAGTTTLVWTPPEDPGGTGLAFDTLRADGSQGFEAAVCLETDGGPDALSTDDTLPPPDTAFFYLVRCENTCPSGQGSVGTGTGETPRPAASCPPAAGD
jgi:alpha-tubulin suppressor-like RCC1 family protein